MQINLNKKETKILIVLIVALIFGLGYQLAGESFTSPYNEPYIEADSDNLETENQSSTSDSKEFVADVVYVHIVGEVKKPGVYKFPEGTRVTEAVEAAEPTEEADLSAINMAEVLYDQQQISIPKIGEALTGEVTQNGKININMASQQELETLTGIGPALALRIIDYRKSHGRFKSVEDLKKVSGIGEKKFAQIKDQITI